MSGDTDTLSGARGPESARAGKRARDHLFADAGTVVAESGEPTVRGSRQAWSPGTFDAVAAGLWADDALAPTSGAKSEQGTLDRVGHSCLGRASPRRRGPAGMASADLGPHHDARTTMGAGTLVWVSFPLPPPSPLSHNPDSHS